ncbi:MAG TPA: hypothetical protein VFE37_26175 [Chloroflexota bacterium]|nr:hypothetical protein [Chloroflexota bacterium]
MRGDELQAAAARVGLRQMAEQARVPAPELRLITHYVPEVADGLRWQVLQSSRSGRLDGEAGRCRDVQLVADQDPRMNRCALAGIVEAAAELAQRIRPALDVRAGEGRERDGG